MAVTPRRIVVTGGAGLVGQNLLFELDDRDRYEVRVLDKNSHNLGELCRLHPSVEAVNVDLAEAGDWHDRFEGVDVVVQLHAQIGSTNRKDFERNNMVATENVLEAMRKHHVPYLVHVSSSVVNSVTQDDYTGTKRRQEELVFTSGIDSVVLRPTLMFGWFDRKHLGWLSRFMQQSPIFPVPGRGRYVRQPLYVRDFCRVIARCLESQPRGEVYEIAGREHVTYIDIIRSIRATVRARCWLVYMPVWLFAFLLRTWALFDKNPPFTADQLVALVAGDRFELTDWPTRFGVIPTPFATAIDETFTDPTYSAVVLEF